MVDAKVSLSPRDDNDPPLQTTCQGPISAAFMLELCCGSANFSAACYAVVMDVLGNPSSSYLWMIPLVTMLFSLPGIFVTDFQQCCHGGKLPVWRRWATYVPLNIAQDSSRVANSVLETLAAQEAPTTSGLGKCRPW